MADTLEFELVSPAKLLVSEPVEMVVVPGTEGAFGVLPQHSPTLSTLRPGFVDVYNGGEITKRYLVTGGFAEVTATTCTVLVDDVVPGEEATREYAAERLSSAQAELANAADEDAKTKAAVSVDIAEAIVREVSA